MKNQPAVASRYYFHCEGVSAIAHIPGDFTAEQWGRVQNQFEAVAVPDAEKRRLAYTAMERLHPEWQHAGVHWSESLAGSQGMSFLLLPFQNTTDADIEKCKRHLRANRDVCGIAVKRARRWESETLHRIVQSVAAANTVYPPPHGMPSGPVFNALHLIAKAAPVTYAAKHGTADFISNGSPETDLTVSFGPAAVNITMPSGAGNFNPSHFSCGMVVSNTGHMTDAKEIAAYAAAIGEAAAFAGDIIRTHAESVREAQAQCESSRLAHPGPNEYEPAHADTKPVAKSAKQKA